MAWIRNKVHDYQPSALLPASTLPWRNKIQIENVVLGSHYALEHLHLRLLAYLLFTGSGYHSLLEFPHLPFNIFNTSSLNSMSLLTGSFFTSPHNVSYTFPSYLPKTLPNS